MGEEKYGFFILIFSLLAMVITSAISFGCAWHLASCWCSLLFSTILGLVVRGMDRGAPENPENQSAERPNPENTKIAQDFMLTSVVHQSSAIYEYIRIFDYFAI